MSYNYHLLFKYILLGDVNVGKSALLCRFANDKFDDNYQPTLGVEFGSHLFQIDSSKVKIMIWDTAGQQTFKSIIKSYYKSAIIALVVFDLSNHESFENVPKWIQEIRNNSLKYIKIYLVGTKADLVDKRAVSAQQIDQFVKKMNYQYYEVSARTKKNVNSAFEQPARQLKQDIQSKRLILNPNMNIGIKIGNPEKMSVQKVTIELQNQKKNKQQCKC